MKTELGAWSEKIVASHGFLCVRFSLGRYLGRPISLKLTETNNTYLNHSVSSSGSADVASVLLDHGADPELTDYKGRKAIDMLRLRPCDADLREMLHKLSM